MRIAHLLVRYSFTSIFAVLALSGPSRADGIQNISGSTSGTSSTWVAGAQGGYDWQSGSAVFGLETDFSFAHLRSSVDSDLTCSPVACSADTPPPSANTRSSVDWYGTLRGRAGWATGPMLVYGTAGLAYGKVNLNSSFKNRVYTHEGGTAPEPL